jgi:hypothetical protein
MHTEEFHVGLSSSGGVASTNMQYLTKPKAFSQITSVSIISDSAETCCCYRFI